MTAYESKPRAAGFLVSEANGDRSRDNVTVASGAGVLEAGTVLGVITASGKVAAYDENATDGTEVAAAVLYSRVDATSSDAEGVAVVRDAEVNSRLLIGLGNGFDDLDANGIIVR